MEITEAIKSSRGELWSIAENGLHKSFNKAHKDAEIHSKYKRPQEPDYIATLVGGIASIAREWNKALSRFGITTSFAAVYCHQRPIVQIKNPPIDISNKNPEIGDLLIVHIHHPRKGRTKRRSLLLQAKVDRRKNGAVRVPRTDNHQLYLYEKWPSFKFSKPRLTSNSFQINTTSPHEGARYLLIENTAYPRYTPLMYSTSTPDVFLNKEYHLLDEIMGLLTLKRGKSFYGRKSAKKRNDWSRLIWELLENSFDKPYKRSNIGIEDLPRLDGANLSGLSGVCLNFIDKKSKESGVINKIIADKKELNLVEELLTNGDFPNANGREGISTIIIETHEKTLN
ncbi:hypothetical protein GLW00_12800 [Halobacillus litoralis]|uniref:Uncharacterized protein n=1 Tax=Halobacillus litoralis TaxID=45668 RepID=A0A845FD58_9BACI|nr:hypothetical protein [Halobacillus litoralis]MYL71738.1 hypothetical protein [Halobacillus litoralis]